MRPPFASLALRDRLPLTFAIAVCATLWGAWAGWGALLGFLMIGCWVLGGLFVWCNRRGPSSKVPAIANVTLLSLALFPLVGVFVRARVRVCVPYYSTAVANIHNIGDMKDVPIPNLPIYCPAIRASRVPGPGTPYVAVMMDIASRHMLGYFEQGVPDNPFGKYHVKPVDNHWAFLSM
jgi:hypothetical protein